MADVTVAVGDILAAAGIGSVNPPVSIFSGRMGSTPPDALYIRPMPGSAPIRAMGAPLTAPLLERPDVHIVVRNTTWQGLMAKVDAIKVALDRWVGVIGGKRYYIELAYEPIYLGIDENQRHQSSLVFNVNRER